MTYEDALNIYTDGSSFQKPRRGGIGIRYITINDAGDEIVTDDVPPGYEQATNNQMELMACIMALEGARSHPSITTVQRVVIFTDSMYVRDNVSSAIYTWRKRKWTGSDGRPIENVDLWKKLVREMQKCPVHVDFEWTPGHSQNKHNKAVDKLAKKSANGFLNPTLTAANVRRKITTESVQIGSVGMHGQEMSVRIIDDKWLKQQKLYKYRYEVLSEDSEYHGKVDLIFSKHVMCAGHHYRVRVNTGTRNPRIEEVLEELERD